MPCCAKTQHFECSRRRPDLRGHAEHSARRMSATHGSTKGAAQAVAYCSGREVDGLGSSNRKVLVRVKTWRAGRRQAQAGTGSGCNDEGAHLHASSSSAEGEMSGSGPDGDEVRARPSPLHANRCRSRSVQSRKRRSAAAESDAVRTCGPGPHRDLRLVQRALLGAARLRFLDPEKKLTDVRGRPSARGSAS